MSAVKQGYLIGSISAGTPTQIIDYASGVGMVVAAGENVLYVSVYQPVGNTLSTNGIDRTIQVGINGNAGKYIATTDLCTKDALNSGYSYSKLNATDFGSGSSFGVYATFADGLAYNETVNFDVNITTHQGGSMSML